MLLIMNSGEPFLCEVITFRFHKAERFKFHGSSGLGQYDNAKLLLLLKALNAERSIIYVYNNNNNNTKFIKRHNAIRRLQRCWRNRQSS